MHATASGGGRSMGFDVPLTSSSIPPEQTFAIKVPPSVTGSFAVTVELSNSNGDVIATDTQSVMLQGGKVNSLPIPIGAASDDMSNVVDDMPMPADMAMPGDMTLPPIVPKAPVLETDLVEAGLSDVKFTVAEVLVNTDTGQIKTSTGNELRAPNAAAGQHQIISGIGYRLDTAGVGVFSFRTLEVPQGTTLKLIGAKAVALTAARDISIDGLVEVRPMNATGVLCMAGATAPGGFAGGPAGMYNTAGNPGLGAGGGPAGSEVSGNGSGGGGAGHTTAGGKSGPGGGTTPCSGLAAGVAGGTTYASASYSGGSGGGSGGGSAGVKGGEGGAGGGGIGLVANGTIRIGFGTAVAGVNVGGCGGVGGVGGIGGGGSAGTILVQAGSLQLGPQGVLAANGGGGGGALGPGQHGGLNGNPALGEGVGSRTEQTGGNGGGADKAPTDGTTYFPMYCEGGGGGGGASGFIRIERCRA